MGLAFVLGPAGAQAASLIDDLQYLVETNPRVQAAQKNVLAADAGIDEAFGDYLPSVDLRGDAGYAYVDSPGRRANPALGAFEGGRESATLTVNQKLWDGGARGAEYRSAVLEREASESALRATRQEVLLAGAIAYMNVLRQSRLLDLSRQNENNIMTQLDLENERVQRGSGIAVDVLQAKSRLQVAKERRVAVEGALQDAQTRYRQVFGRAPDIATMTRPRPPLALLPETVEEAIAIAQEENPAITSGDKQIAIADERRNIAESGYYPRFDLELAGTYENDVDGTDGIRRDFTALLKANWNIFDGFATKAAVARTAFEHAATRDTQANTRRRVTEQVRLAWEALETARDRVTLL